MLPADTSAAHLRRTTATFRRKRAGLTKSCSQTNQQATSETQSALLEAMQERRLACETTYRSRIFWCWRRETPEQKRYACGGQLDRFR